MERDRERDTEHFPEHPGWKPVRCPQIHADSLSGSRKGHGKDRINTEFCSPFIPKCCKSYPILIP